MTPFIPADLLSLLQADCVHAPAGVADGLLAGYRCLLESWQQALDNGAADPAGHALSALARHVEQRRLRQLRALGSPSLWWEALASMPLPPADLLTDPGLLPGWAVSGIELWQALLVYRQQMDKFCALYEGFGACALARLNELLAGSADIEIDTVIELHAHWQGCQDECEAVIVRSASYARRLAQVIGAVAAVRVAHRQWLAQWFGIETGAAAQRALSDEIAAIRRQLRELPRVQDRHQ